MADPVRLPTKENIADFAVSDYVVNGQLAADLTKEMTYLRGTLESIEARGVRMAAVDSNGQTLLRLAVAKDMVKAAVEIQNYLVAFEAVKAISDVARRYVDASAPPTEQAGKDTLEMTGTQLLRGIAGWREACVKVAIAETNIYRIVHEDAPPATQEDLQVELDELAAAIGNLQTLGPNVPEEYR